MNSAKRQLPMHLDKWIVTVREGKDLTRGDLHESFFRKTNPVCELSLDGQGPFSTSVKPNTRQPCWDDSVEFDAAAAAQHASLLLSPSNPTKTHPPVVADEEAGGDDENGAELRLPTAGPKLEVVCYSRSSITQAPAGDAALAPGSSPPEGDTDKVEIGRAEVTLRADGGGGGGGGVQTKVRIPLFRVNALGCQVAAGSVMLEYMLVPGIPRPATPVSTEEAVTPVEDPRVTARATPVAGGGVRSRPGDELQKPAWKVKPALLAGVGATIAAVLGARLAGVRESMPTDLSPIPVPATIRVGKHKGSRTHHIRLQDDGNIVVAMGPKPLAVSGEAGAAATTLWQSGPLQSLEQPSGKPGGGKCKKCEVRVAKDGTLALVRGNKEELAVFTPEWAEAFFDVSAHAEKH